MTSPLILPYRNFYDTIIHRSIPITSNHSHNDIYNRIIQPYNPEAFKTFLMQHNLIDFYPLLVTNLRSGFPLGEMPALTQTVILNNHPSTLQYPDTIAEYLTDEVQSGRMTGPFSRNETEQILRGPFFSSPLIVSVQPQGPGIADKLRVCRHLSKSNKTTASVNSYIKKEDFPTRFDTASRVADIVSYIDPDNLKLPQLPSSQPTLNLLRDTPVPQGRFLRYSKPGILLVARRAHFWWLALLQFPLYFWQANYWLLTSNRVYFW